MEEQLTMNLSVIVAKTEFQEAYDFEIYDVKKAVGLFKQYRPILYLLIGLYVSGIYFGQRWMKNRPPYKLKSALFFWNAGLAAFSIAATIRGYPQTMYLLSQPDGVYRIVCTTEVFNYATAFWALMYALSKIVELGDTVFIVLRKQKLIFLHWYHHLAVLIFSWVGYEFKDTFSQIFILNTFVHSVMYSYYALRARGISVPKKVAMAITALQITQMLIYFYVTIQSLFWMQQGVPCVRDISMVYLVLFATVTFFILFLNFFIRTYLGSRKMKAN